jgi:hypothetical protein
MRYFNTLRPKGIFTFFYGTSSSVYHKIKSAVASKFERDGHFHNQLQIHRYNVGPPYSKIYLLDYTPNYSVRYTSTTKHVVNLLSST